MRFSISILKFRSPSPAAMAGSRRAVYPALGIVLVRVPKRAPGLSSHASLPHEIVHVRTTFVDVMAGVLCAWILAKAPRLIADSFRKGVRLDFALFFTLPVEDSRLPATPLAGGYNRHCGRP